MTRSGIGYDSHRVEGRKLMIGGVDVPFEKRDRSAIPMPTFSHTPCATRYLARHALGTSVRISPTPIRSGKAHPA